MSQLKQASVLTREAKISLILVPCMPDIKLTRTDERFNSEESNYTNKDYNLLSHSNRSNVIYDMSSFKW